MTSSRLTKTFWSLFLSCQLCTTPSFALTTQSSQMISTMDFVQQIDAQAAQKKINDYISQDEVKKALSAHGLTAEEVSQRLASLSEKEISDLAQQVDQARAGGDILVTVLLVVLIIFLIKRI